MPPGMSISNKWTFLCKATSSPWDWVGLLTNKKGGEWCRLPVGEYTVAVLYTLPSLLSRSGMDPVGEGFRLWAFTILVRGEQTSEEPNTGLFGGTGEHLDRFTLRFLYIILLTSRITNAFCVIGEMHMTIRWIKAFLIKTNWKQGLGTGIHRHTLWREKQFTYGEDNDVRFGAARRIAFCSFENHFSSMVQVGCTNKKLWSTQRS